MTRIFDVHPDYDMVVLAIRLSPHGVTLSWVLTPSEAIRLAEGLFESRSPRWDGYTFGQVGEYSYAVAPTKEGTPGMLSLSLGLGKDAAEVTWSFAPDAISYMADTMLVAAGIAKISNKRQF